MSGKQIVIYAAANLPQAHVLRNALEEQGIPATVTNDSLQLAVGDIPAGWSTAPRIVVDEQHADLARRIALEFDAADRDSWLRDESAEQPEALAVMASWPPCPKCGNRREAVCAYCGAIGDSFAPADLTCQTVEGHADAGRSTTDSPADQRSSGARRDWLVCPTCEEPFAAQYERTCAHCGHDFGDGVKRPETPRALLFSPRWLIPVLIFLAAAILFASNQPVLGCVLVLIVALATIVRWSLDAGPMR